MNWNVWCRSGEVDKPQFVCLVGNEDSATWFVSCFSIWICSHFHLHHRPLRSFCMYVRIYLYLIQSAWLLFICLESNYNVTTRRSQLSPHRWRHPSIAFAARHFPEVCGAVSLCFYAFLFCLFAFSFKLCYNRQCCCVVINRELGRYRT